MIRPIYVITTILFFAHSMAFCMEPVATGAALQKSTSVALLETAQAPLLPMTKIRHWSAVGPFRDCVVAYTTKSDYFRPKSGYFSSPDQEIEFGWIVDAPAQKWQISGEQCSGHVMRRLIKADAVSRECALTRNQLSDKAALSMRGATRSEVEGIREVIESGKAVFENTAKKDALALLDRYRLKVLNAQLQQDKCADCCSIL